MTLTCATPVTVTGTPSEVSTCSQTGLRVINSRDNLSDVSQEMKCQPDSGKNSHGLRDWQKIVYKYYTFTRPISLAVNGEKCC